jgi:hypothetical protein
VTATERPSGAGGPESAGFQDRSLQPLGHLPNYLSGTTSPDSQRENSGPDAPPTVASCRDESQPVASSHDQSHDHHGAPAAAAVPAPSCAHLRVSYRTEEVEQEVVATADHPGGRHMLTRGWWECDLGCGTHFIPAPGPSAPAESFEQLLTRQRHERAAWLDRKRKSEGSRP